MKNHEKKVELLAPAGSEEAFYGAIHGGADAVYLAGDRFGARAYAENFDTETLLKCIHYGTKTIPDGEYSAEGRRDEGIVRLSGPFL